MDIALQPVCASNWFAVTQLHVSGAQRDFVATNSFSLAQAAYMPQFYPFAICADGQPVGFLLYGFDEELGAWMLHRLMVDARFQKQGIGRRALALLLERLRAELDTDEFYTSAEPQNAVALALYEQMGFENLHKIVDDEVLLRIRLRKGEPA